MLVLGPGGAGKSYLLGARSGYRAQVSAAQQYVDFDGDLIRNSFRNS